MKNNIITISVIVLFSIILWISVALSNEYVSTINIPINSLCWDSDLPCINGDLVNGDVRATSSLHLIKDGDLSSGFSVK